MSGIADGAEVNVQADWNTTDTTADSYIKNKPTIPTVPTFSLNFRIPSISSDKYAKLVVQFYDSSNVSVGTFNTYSNQSLFDVFNGDTSAPEFISVSELTRAGIIDSSCSEQSLIMSISSVSSSATWFTYHWDECNTSGTSTSTGELGASRLGSILQIFDDNGNYITPAQLNSKLEEYVTNSSLETTLEDYAQLSDLDAKLGVKIDVEQSTASALAISSGHSYKWSLPSNGTLSLDSSWETGKSSEAIIEILPGSSYSVTCSGDLELADTLTASALNHCVVRWDGTFARLYVVDTEDIGTITATAQTITGTVNTAMAIDISDYVTVSTGANPSFAVASGSTLPAGLTLGSDGYLEGTPTATSSAVVNVNVSARNCTTVTLVLTFNITSGGGTVSYVYNSSGSSGSYNNGTYVYDSSTNTAICESAADGEKHRLYYNSTSKCWTVQRYTLGAWEAPNNSGMISIYNMTTSDISAIVGTKQWYNDWDEMNENVTITQQ